MLGKSRGEAVFNSSLPLRDTERSTESSNHFISQILLLLLLVIIIQSTVSQGVSAAGHFEGSLVGNKESGRHEQRIVKVGGRLSG